MVTFESQKTFHLFNLLPVEIRSFIWEEYFLDRFGRQPQAHRLLRPNAASCQWPSCSDDIRLRWDADAHNKAHESVHEIWACPICANRPEPLKHNVSKFYCRDGFLRQIKARHQALWLDLSPYGTEEQQRTWACLELLGGARSPIRHKVWHPPRDFVLEILILNSLGNDALRVARTVLAAHFQPVNLHTPLCTSPNEMFQAPAGYRTTTMDMKRTTALLSWPTDLLFFDSCRSNDRLELLKRAPYASHIRALAVEANAVPRGEVPTGIMCSLIKALPALRDFYVFILDLPFSEHINRAESAASNVGILQQLLQDDPSGFTVDSFEDLRRVYHGLNINTRYVNKRAASGANVVYYQGTDSCKRCRHRKIRCQRPINAKGGCSTCERGEITCDLATAVGQEATEALVEAEKMDRRAVAQALFGLATTLQDLSRRKKPELTIHWVFGQ